MSEMKNEPSLVAAARRHLAEEHGPMVVKSPHPWPREFPIRPRLLSDAGQYVYELTEPQLQKMVGLYDSGAK